MVPRVARAAPPTHNPARGSIFTAAVFDYTRAMTLLRSVATVGSYTLLSRVMGFVRDILTAALLGAGPVADAFFVAQRLPNLFRSLFAEGAFSAAFVPLFAGTIAEQGKEAARAFRRRHAGGIARGVAGLCSARRNLHALGYAADRTRVRRRSRKSSRWLSPSLASLFPIFYLSR